VGEHVVLECPSQTGGEFMTHALTICLSSLLLLHRVASDDAAVLRKDPAPVGGRGTEAMSRPRSDVRSTRAF